MTWFKFAICLAVLYALYYGLLILWDILQARRGPVNESSLELTFIEDAAPAIVEMSAQQGTAGTSAVVSSGGVLLKQIFKLAQEEAIDYIRPVSF